MNESNYDKLLSSVMRLLSTLNHCLPPEQQIDLRRPTETPSMMLERAADQLRGRRFYDKRKHTHV